MHELALALLGVGIAAVVWLLLRSSLSSHSRTTQAAASILDRRHAVRAELDALLGTEDADLLLCGMARHEGHPVFDLALLERALVSARALSGRAAVLSAGGHNLQSRAAGRQVNAPSGGAILRSPIEQQIEIPLPRSLSGQLAARRAHHG